MSVCLSTRRGEGGGWYPISGRGRTNLTTGRGTLSSPTGVGWGEGLPPSQDRGTLGYHPIRLDDGSTQLGWMGTPHPPLRQHSEYLLRGGRYTSCVHTGGLSCLNEFFFFYRNLLIYFVIVQVGQAMLRLEDRENVGKVILSTEEYEDANSFHGEDVSICHREIQR